MHSIEQLKSGLTATLAEIGLVRASGEDAVTFLHGQLSHDVAGLAPDEARFAGYCTPEGRLLATLLVWKSEDGVRLLMPREILPSLVQRLRMYVLRARVTLTDVSDDFAVTGFAGKKAREALASVLQTLPARVFGRTDGPWGTLIRIRDAFDDARFLQIAPLEGTRFIPPALSSTLVSGDDADWELGEIEAGMPQIYAATQNRFVPQMVNMEQLDGMSFKKGCYPGQEVIARTQYRGKLARRMVAAHADMPGNANARESGITPGLEIVDAATNAPCGILVRAARRDEKRMDCLIVIPKEAFASKSLHLGAPDGPKLFLDPLPYALPDEI